MNHTKSVFFILLLFLKCILLNGQGCSDAGFCTINNLRPLGMDTSNDKSNQLKAGISYGAADYSISVLSPFLEYSRHLTDRLSVDAKITSLAQNGNDVSVFGLSDLFLSANVALTNRLSITIASKFPFNDASRFLNGRPLPMDYQSSLGTYDLILGINYHIRKIQFAAAIQHPLNQNKNEFLAELYPADSELSKFQSTNKFIRSSDVLVRVSLPLMVNNRLTLIPGLLPIYHLIDDKYTDSMSNENSISGSAGLTLNVNLHLDLRVGSNDYLQFNFAAPLIVRDSRPDGLTRSFIVTLEYRTGF